MYNDENNNDMMMMPPSLKSMFITSIDTLMATSLNQVIPREEGWNDQPPLFVEQQRRLEKQRRRHQNNNNNDDYYDDYDFNNNNNSNSRSTKREANLLKGMIRKGVPHVLQCAVWLSNIILSVHPQKPLEYAYEYRTLAKVRAIDISYETLLNRIITGRQKKDGDDAIVIEIPQSSLCSSDENCKQLWFGMMGGRNARMPTFGLAYKKRVPPQFNNPLLFFNNNDDGSDNNNHDDDDNNDTPATTPVSNNNISGGSPPENGQLALKRVLLSLQEIIMGGVIASEYAPIIPTLAAIFLTRMSESYAFCAIREMTHHFVHFDNYKPNHYYFPVSPREEMAWCYAYVDVLSKLHPQTYNTWHATITDTTKPCMGLYPIFQDFFVTILPMRYVVRIIDIYTLEGSKVIFRFAIALMVLFKIHQDEQQKQKMIQNYVQKRHHHHQQQQQQHDNHNGNNNDNNHDSSSSDQHDNDSKTSTIADGTTSNATTTTTTSASTDHDGNNDDHNDAKHHDQSHSNKDHQPPNLWVQLSEWTHSPEFSWQLVTKKAYGLHGRGVRRQKRFPTRRILSRIMQMEEQRLSQDPKYDSWNYYDDANDDNNDDNHATSTINNTSNNGNHNNANDSDNKQNQEKEEKQRKEQQHEYKERQEEELMTGRPLGLLDPADNQSSSASEPASFFNNNKYNNNSFKNSSNNKETVQMILGSPIQTRIRLNSWLPLVLQNTSLQLLYSTNHHGRMLETFYNRVSNHRNTILLCEAYNTNSGAVTIIGMYASQTWHVSSRVYGDGSCFLFRLKPNPMCWKWKGTAHDNHSNRAFLSDDEEEDEIMDNGSNDYGDNDNDDHVLLSPEASWDKDETTAANTTTTVTTAMQELDLDEIERNLTKNYIATNNNNSQTALLEQFMVSTSTYISMGGNPDGSCGLRLNEDFTIAESTTAVGFNNEPLAGVNQTRKGGGGDVLEVGLVEVYGLVQTFY